MKFVSSMVFGLYFCAGAALAQPAEFNGSTGVLTIPEISVEGQVYRNAKLQLEDASSLTFRLISIEEPLGQCSESNINFIRYGSLPTFHSVTTDAELNTLIGCSATVTTEDVFRILRWNLPTSTEGCPRFIEAKLAPIETSTPNSMAIINQMIVGINSETNLPYNCGT